MARLDDWQTNLSRLIEDKRAEPFAFPTWNCLMWAFAGIEAVTGRDLGLPYRGKYKDERSAAKLLRKVDQVKTSQELLEKHLGEARAVAFARPGDIVLVNPADTGLELPADIELFGLVPGICYGETSFYVGETGLIQVETLRLGQAIWVS